jgi:hypothetical protein
MLRWHSQIILKREGTHILRRTTDFCGILLSGPVTRHWGALGERRYSSYSFFSSALEGGEWSAPRPGRALPPGKEPPEPTV